MTTQRKTTSGTITSATTSSSVWGRRVSAVMTSSGTATVALQFEDWDGTWKTAISYTATPTELPVVVEDIVPRAWRWNVTAYTSGNVVHSLAAE